LQNIKLKGEGLIPNPPLRTPLLNINYQRSQLGYRRKIQSTTSTQQFISAKISGCTLKRGKTHSSLRPSNLQLQNEAALMSCRIRAVEHRKCVAGPAGAHPALQDRILQNCTRIENTHEVCKKTSHFFMHRSPANF